MPGIPRLVFEICKSLHAAQYKSNDHDLRLSALLLLLSLPSSLLFPGVGRASSFVWEYTRQHQSSNLIESITLKYYLNHYSDSTTSTMKSTSVATVFVAVAAGVTAQNSSSTTYITKYEYYNSCDSTSAIPTVTDTDILTYCSICAARGMTTFEGGSFTIYETVLPAQCSTGGIEDKTYVFYLILYSLPNPS